LKGTEFIALEFTNILAMEKQYCKVGMTKPITGGEQTAALLTYLHQNFMDKASQIQYANSKLGEFFEQKALKIKKLLDKSI
jgi:hypothetical protein